MYRRYSGYISESINGSYKVFSLNLFQIQRIQNPTLWRSLQIKKHDMELRNGHQKNEKRLFHGTCHTTINHINNHGFNRSFAGKNGKTDAYVPWTRSLVPDLFVMSCQLLWLLVKVICTIILLLILNLACASHLLSPVSAVVWNQTQCIIFPATAFGYGTYFAVGASYSARSTYSRPDLQGQKYMYLCRVLTGDFTTGKQGMKVPPPKSTTTIQLYDSVTDGVSPPSMFIIFHDNQAYPEYLITFK